jgi:anti-anti-sigma factor
MTAVLNIQTTGCGTVTVVVCGKLDVACADQLRAVITELLNRGDVTAINLDVNGVTFADSTGLGTVIVAHRIATAVGVSLRCSAAPPIEGELAHLLGAGASQVPGTE